MMRRPQKSTQSRSSAASEVYKRPPDAYERLFLEVIKGDQWLFVSRDEIEASWDWCDTLLSAWNDQKIVTKSYSAGSLGPSKADILIEKDGRSWYEG